MMGVIMFIKNYITACTTIQHIGQVNVLIAQISILKCAIYRYHDVILSEFVDNMNLYLTSNVKERNYFIVGDFNVDILCPDGNRENFLYFFLKNVYSPSFYFITRPNNEGGGPCIDNVYGKSNNITKKVHKLIYRLTGMTLFLFNLIQRQVLVKT